jgi:hypothetical protein
MGKKKPQGTLAVKLAPVREKMAAEEAARDDTARAARKRREAEAARRAPPGSDEEGLTDEERFDRAVSGMAPRDKSRKYDFASTPKDLPRPPQPNDEEVFLKAMTTLPKEGSGSG